ncbi:MAG TPA: type II 3-dehydroquinate dehydratase [Candidatus Limnocylindria bacterium]|nr:type II 3-dehydroquinate dehydratase [Candidatus Limnocylindria bacterium]
MRILLLNGPNLGSLGRRQPEVYGSTTLAEIEESCRAHALERGALLDAFQSNHEGELIDRLEQLDYDAVICNFGAYTHTSYALHDALVTAGKPAVEVHISDINAREPWRRTSVTAPATRHQVIGHGWRGYLEAIDWLLEDATRT